MQVGLIALALSFAALAWAGGEQDGLLPERMQSDVSKRGAERTPGKDPFSARSWEPRTETKGKPSPPEKQAEAQAPPLPFVYRGSLTLDGATLLVLTRADRDYVVRAGDTLDGAYLVERIEAQRVVLKYLPLGIQQMLPLAAPGTPAGGTSPKEEE